MVPSALRSRPRRCRRSGGRGRGEPPQRTPARYRPTLRREDRAAAQRPVSPLSDEELVLRYRFRADGRAFDELVRRYRRALCRFLLRYVGDAVLAEDVVQATFLQLHLKSHQYEEGRRFRPWLYSIATHQAIDSLRRAQNRPMVRLERLAGDRGSDVWSRKRPTRDPLADLLTEERRRWVREEVARLPEHLRRVILLTYFRGLKRREVARLLRIPLGTVKSRLPAALARLKSAWVRRHGGPVGAEETIEVRR